MQVVNASPWLLLKLWSLKLRSAAFPGKFSSKKPENIHFRCFHHDLRTFIQMGAVKEFLGEVRAEPASLLCKDSFRKHFTSLESSSELEMF